MCAFRKHTGPLAGGFCATVARDLRDTAVRVNFGTTVKVPERAHVAQEAF